MPRSTVFNLFFSPLLTDIYMNRQSLFRPALASTDRNDVAVDDILLEVSRISKVGWRQKQGRTFSVISPNSKSNKKEDERCRK